MGNVLAHNFIVSFCREQIAQQGEDSFCYAFCDEAGMVAVFDGCGGAGAQKHKCYGGHSEAYIASRLCAGVVYDDFCKSFPNQESTEDFVCNTLTPDLKQVLRSFAPVQEGTGPKIRGSMVRTLPTTAAMAIIRPDEENWAQISAVWAGDSRVYILDANGLAQLTVDDTTVPDPMENLYEDGILKNLICMDRPVRLHCKDYRVKLPFMVFAATDGCFGYVSTPMEFESMLLSSLLKCGSPAQWESALAQTVEHFAGDDHTLCLVAYGYKNMEHLHSTLAERNEVLDNDYLQPLRGEELDARTLRRTLWERYKPNYCRFLKDGVDNGNAG